MDLPFSPGATSATCPRLRGARYSPPKRTTRGVDRGLGKLDLVTIWIKVACTLPSCALYSISPNPPPESGREVTAVAGGVAAVPATEAPTPVLEAHVANFITASASRTPMRMPTPNAAVTCRHVGPPFVRIVHDLARQRCLPGRVCCRQRRARSVVVAGNFRLMCRTSSKATHRSALAPAMAETPAQKIG